MKQIGVLFKGEMVRAILDGRKTVTRRLAKPQPDTIHDGEPYWNVGGYRCWKSRGVTDVLRMGGLPLLPKYSTGDLIYAKETFWKNSHPHVHFTGENIKTQDEVTWRSDSDQAVDQKDYEARPGTWLPNCKWTSSIFMPKALSRIWLRVVDVRCERLQEITEGDALAEGVIGCARQNSYPRGTDGQPNRAEYAILWDSVNTDPGTQWDQNPFVWRIAFERVDKPT